MICTCGPNFECFNCYQARRKKDNGSRLRDEFAMAALIGMLARNSGPSIDVEKAAYEYADALLAAREAK